MTITCAHCGTAPTTRAGAPPWCPRCEIWLFRCDLTGDWVSAATRRRRQADAANARAIAASRDAAHAAQPEAQRLLPTDWSATVSQGITGAPYSLYLRPAPSEVDVYAYLSPPDGDRGWYVRIHNRTDHPVYIPGGARAAYFTTVADAVAAAVNAVRIEQSRR